VTERRSATRVFIVATIRLYRDALAQMLGRGSGLVVVGATCNPQDLAPHLATRAPDVVIVDIASSESCPAVRDVRRLAPDLPVVALGVSEIEDDVLACVEAGASGYVTRDNSMDDLVRVVESAARGELQCSPRIAGSLLRRVAALAARREHGKSSSHLTSREREIVRLIDQDLSNKEIATRLGIEVATVKNHVHNLLEKLNVHRRTEAVRVCTPDWAASPVRPGTKL